MAKRPSETPVDPEKNRFVRSAVANGSRLFVQDIDGRTALARRYRDLLIEFTSDIGGDPSEAQRQLIRRAAAISCWCEAIEVKLANGDTDINISNLTTATNALRRILKDIGLERRDGGTKLVTLDDYCPSSGFLGQLAC